MKFVEDIDDGYMFGVEKENSEKDWRLMVGLVYYMEERKAMEGIMRRVKEKVKKWKYGRLWFEKGWKKWKKRK